jgi:hypothetical protein
VCSAVSGTVRSFSSSSIPLAQQVIRPEMK